MGSRDSGSVAPGIGQQGQRPGGVAPRGARRLCLLLVAVLAAALVPSVAQASTPPSALKHIFGSSFAPTGKCALSEPTSVAVQNSTGDIFVYNHGTNSISWFTSEHACIARFKVGKAETGEEGNEGIAVDNSSGPSSGDLYAVEPEEHAILKYRFEEGHVKLAGKIKKFKKYGAVKGEVEFEAEEFEEIHGLAIDATGKLWVYQGEVIYGFSGAEKNPVETKIEPATTCAPRPGFAVNADASLFYLGRERENQEGGCEEATVMVRFGAQGEPVAERQHTGTYEPVSAYQAQLDNEPTSGVALDQTREQVYFDNATNMSAFAGEQFVQRFGRAPEPEPLVNGKGVATNPQTGEVFVVDAAESTPKVKVYIPASEVNTPPTRSPSLPDGRAWELVSPQNKHGASLKGIGVTGNGGYVQAAEDGSALVYSASGPITETTPANRAPESQTVISRRGATAWSTESITTPRQKVPVGYLGGQNGTEFRFFSPDLKAALLEPGIGATEANEPSLSAEVPTNETTLYRRDLTKSAGECEPVPSGCYTALVSSLNDTAGSHFGAKVHVDSATADASHVVLSSDVPLTSEATGEAPEFLYEWEGTGSPGGALKLVSAFPAGEAAEGEDIRLGGEGFPYGGVMRGAISNTGTRVVWSTTSGAINSPGRLYVRDTQVGETFRVDTAKGVAQPETAGARFVGASPEGTKIFFTDSHKLTPNATAEVGEAEEAEQQLGDLYVCEVGAVAGKLGCATLTDLTAGVAAANESALVQGVMGFSEHGADVYYVADGVLAPPAGRGNCVPLQTQTEHARSACNVYVQHFNGTSWESPRYVTSLTSEDEPDWQPNQSVGALGAVTSSVSSTGQYLAFMSNSPLTGYNNVDKNPEAHGARDEEVFLFDAKAGHIVCPSCNPTGAQPSGFFDQTNSGEGINPVVDRPGIWTGRWLAANVPGWTPRSAAAALYQSRYLSENGRLFFNSPANLVPAATNGRNDVYEYEPEGVGSCTSPTGCVSLISSGSSHQESAFLDASVGGSDVFFLTAERLVPTLDTDNAFDVYDARICTGASPCITPSEVTPAKCTAEPSEATCKEASATAPALPPAPASSTSGPGNAGTHVVLSFTESRPPAPKHAETNAQKLAKALKACKKDHKKKKRQQCERAARRRYPVKKAKKAAGASSHTGRKQ